MSNTSRWLAVSVVVLALGCKSEEDGASGTGGTAAGTAAGATVTGGTTAGTMTTGGTAAGTTAGTAAGTAAPAMCGSTACTIADPNLAAIAAPCCNTMTSMCGMMTVIGGCQAAYVDPGGHMCPNETIAGMMVPGCCTTGGTECGVVDVLLGSMGCASRATVGQIAALLDPTLMLGPINCDGTMPMVTPDAGM